MLISNHVTSVHPGLDPRGRSIVVARALLLAEEIREDGNPYPPRGNTRDGPGESVASTPDFSPGPTGPPNGGPVYETAILGGDPGYAPLGLCIPSGEDGAEFLLVVRAPRVWRMARPWKERERGEDREDGLVEAFLEGLDRTWLHEFGHALLKPFRMAWDDEEGALLWIQNRVWAHMERDSRAPSRDFYTPGRIPGDERQPT